MESPSILLHIGGLQSRQQPPPPPSLTGEHADSPWTDARGSGLLHGMERTKSTTTGGVPWITLTCAIALYFTVFLEFRFFNHIIAEWILLRKFFFKSILSKEAHVCKSQWRICRVCCHCNPRTTTAVAVHPRLKAHSTYYTRWELPFL